MRSCQREELRPSELVRVRRLKPRRTRARSYGASLGFGFRPGGPFCLPVPRNAMPVQDLLFVLA